MRAGDRTDRVVVVVGVALLAGYLAQAYVGFEIGWLARLQATDSYKIASGLGVAVYVLRQSFMGRRRLYDPNGVLFWHKLGGAIAPLVLYLHASRFAYGYLLLLGAVYLLTTIVGLLHRPVVRAHARWLFTLWFIVHLASAATLVVLGGYHVVIALAYE